MHKESDADLHHSLLFPSLDYSNGIRKSTSIPFHGEEQAALTVTRSEEPAELKASTL